MAEKKKSRRWKDTDRTGYMLFAALFMMLAVMGYTTFKTADMNETVRDNPECILELKQQYCGQFGMEYRTSVIESGVFSKSLKTVETCRNNDSEFVISTYEVDYERCKDIEIDEDRAFCKSLTIDDYHYECEYSNFTYDAPKIQHSLTCSFKSIEFATDSSCGIDFLIGYEVHHGIFESYYSNNQTRYMAELIALVHDGIPDELENITIMIDGETYETEN